MIRKYVRRVRRTFLGLQVRMSYKNGPAAPAPKSIFIDLKEIVFERYFYLFVKFFSLAGYTVYFKPDLHALGCIRVGGYANLLLEEKLLNFSKREKNARLVVSDKGNGVQLSADYFTDLLKKRFDASSYYVPMAMHPNIYHDNYWDTTYSYRKRQSIFFAGGFDKEAYTAMNDQGVFRVLNRVEIYEVLKSAFEVYIPRAFEDSQRRDVEKEIVIIDRVYCEIPIPELRETLAHYAFFLACPGIVMPFSHNVIEAMSVGSIPVIEKEYAEMFIPYLQDGVNAIVFEGAEGLVQQVRRIFQLTEQEVAGMSAHVSEYYRRFLTPEGVVNNIMSSEYKKLYIQAEYHSVALYQDK